MAGEEHGRVLVVTNDFPPRRGGIESFVQALCAGLPAPDLVVYTARMRGSQQVDERAAYPVIRDRTRVLLPTRRVARAVQAVAVEHGCDRVLFGASAPLGLLAGGLRSVGVRRIVALSHGHEVWWARVPGVRGLLRRIGRDVDVVTYVSEFCRTRVASALTEAAASRMVRLSPGVDPHVFAPSIDGGGVRRKLGIGTGQPVVVAASRLVARKGHDVLLAAWPQIVATQPDAVLLIVGDGPARRSIQRAVRRSGAAASLRLLTEARWEDMPQIYAAGDVFAIPCRTRLWGLEPEALGIVFLEAAASGLPVVVGRSGGAPETVVDGETGYVVDPRSVSDVAARVSGLLADAAGARTMGSRGRAWVVDQYSWETSIATLRDLLDLPTPSDSSG